MYNPKPQVPLRSTSLYIIFGLNHRALKTGPFCVRSTLLGSVCVCVISAELPSRKLQLEHLVDLGVGPVLHFRDVKPHDDDRDNTEASKEESRLSPPITLIDVEHIRHEEVEGPGEKSRGHEAQTLRLATKANGGSFAGDNRGGTTDAEVKEHEDEIDHDANIPVGS